MKVSPFIFILIKGDSFILWDYKLHNQYEITLEYLRELGRISAKLPPLNQTIYFELVENHIIVAEEDSEYCDTDWEWDELSKIYHIGTQDMETETLSPTEYSFEYLSDCEKRFCFVPAENYMRHGEKIKLPQVNFNLDNAKFLDVLHARRTCRNFNCLPIALENITHLLQLTFVSSKRDEEHYRSLGLQRVGQRKTSPSGGGLHPSEAYLLVKSVNGLDKGIYHFNSNESTLTKIDSNEVDFAEILNGQYFANDLSAGIFISSAFKKQWWKYNHSRAYRVALLDVGHLSQTLLLSATSLGLATWLSASFNDTKVTKLLKINTISEKPILFVGLGYSNNGDSIDPETLKILGK